jgi:hypothetical protein
MAVKRWIDAGEMAEGVEGLHIFRVRGLWMGCRRLKTGVLKIREFD